MEGVLNEQGDRKRVMELSSKKQSYTIPCSSTFRDAILDLAQRQKVNVADLVRSVMLMVPQERVTDFPDPGNPEKNDRETIILQSGKAKGRPWRRKPRLQVRMVPGCEPSILRRALGLALALDKNELCLSVEGVPKKEDELQQFREVVSLLSFDPLINGIKSRPEALYVFGFSPSSLPDTKTIRTRFRALAAIHHPDSPYGDNHRMSQLNAAMEHLRQGRP
jgi:hypothetical protein